MNGAQPIGLSRHFEVSTSADSWRLGAPDRAIHAWATWRKHIGLFAPLALLAIVLAAGGCAGTRTDVGPASQGTEIEDVVKWSVDDSGNLDFLGVYRGGKLHGPVLEFAANGRTRLLYHYDNGKLDGSYCLWSTEGELLESGEFDEGAPSGFWRQLGPQGRVLSAGRVRGLLGVVDAPQFPRLEHCRRVGQWIEWNDEIAADVIVDYGP